MSRRDEFSIGLGQWVSLALVAIGLLAYLLYRTQGLDDRLLLHAASGIVAATLVAIAAQWTMWRVAGAERWAAVAIFACAAACAAGATGVIYMRDQNARIMAEAASVVRGLNREFAVNFGNPGYIRGGHAQAGLERARQRMAGLARAHARTEAVAAITAMSKVMETMAGTDLDFIRAQARVLDLVEKGNLMQRNRAELLITWRRQMAEDRITIANYGKRLAGLSADCRASTRGLPLDDGTVAAMCSSYTRHLDRRLPLVGRLVDAELDVIDRLDEVLVFAQDERHDWLWNSGKPPSQQQEWAARDLQDTLVRLRDSVERMRASILQVSTLAMAMPDEELA